MKKAFLLSVLMLGLSIFMQAAVNNDTFRCRLNSADQDTHSSIVEKSEEDLLSGIWITGSTVDNEVNQTLMFEKNGKLLVFNETTDRGIRVEEKKWKLMDFEGGVFLVMSSPAKGKEELYKISQTCDGMELKNITTGKLLSFDYSSIKSTNVSKNDLIGSWNNSQYPFEIAQRFDQPGTFEPIRGAFYNLELAENGTYVKHFGSEIKTFSEEGTWSLSKDGKYIIFNVKNGNRSSKDSMEALEISRINDTKLVVKSAINADNISAYTTGTKAFHFSKKS